MIRHIHRKSQRTPEESERMRAERERYQRDKRTPQQLLAEGGHAEFVRLGDLMALHEMMAALKKERQRQKLTLAQLSKTTGIDQAALSRLENGRNPNPTFETVNRLASALGMRVVCSLQEAKGRNERASLA